VIESGSTEEVFRRPLHPYTKGLLRAVPSPKLARHLVAMERVPPRPGTRPTGCSFEPRCPVRIAACRVEQPALLPSDSPTHLVRCLLVSARGPDATAPAFPTSGELHQDGATVNGTPPLLAVRGVSASYGATQVLDGVSLSVRPNACVAIVGESGSGKTTL